MGVTLEGPNLGDLIRSRLKGFNRNLVLEVGYAEGATYPDGTSLVEVAKIQEYGAVIQHPGGTKYAPAQGYKVVEDPKTGKRKRVKKVGVRFVADHFVGEVGITAPHAIIIPARPFFRTALTRYSDKWQKDFAFLLERCAFDVKKALEILGGMVVRDIQQQIDDTHEPPNAPATIRAKKGADHPLIGLHKFLKNELIRQVVENATQ